VLRDHPIFQTPLAINRANLVEKPWPQDWSDAHEGSSITVLPLALEEKRGRMPGWTTYTRDMSEAPEIEVFCGGINSKTATAAALWRQGNLLHYGFDLSPAEMNEWGRAMLVNSIHYIARFTDDRPIMETPSPFAGREFLTRKRIETLASRHDQSWWDFLGGRFDKKTLAAAGVRDLATFAKWFPTVRDVLAPDGEGILRVDADLEVEALDASRPEFLERCIAALERSAEPGARARRLLARYAPEGPGQEASPDAWLDWWKANRDYLFFGEIGGYRWYLDPLAKERGVPTSRLRGPARASRYPLHRL
jgi:hypothetical protein